jgi:twitching motility two-component system response regulator PilG
LNNVRESAGMDVSEPRAGTLPTSGLEIGPSSPARTSTGMTSQQPSLSASMNSMAPMSATSHGMTSSSTAVPSGTLPTAMTASAPAATVLPSMTLQPNVPPPLDKSMNEKPVTEKAVDRILSDKPVEKTAAEKILSSAAALAASGVTPLSPSALSAAVAPTSATRTNLRVVPNPSPLAASLPAAARIADAPMVPPPTAPVPAAAVAAPAPLPLPLPIPVAPVSSAPTPRHEEHNFRVLAVDDSPLMRTFLQNKLQPYGISPEFASSGEEALFKISKQHFDMIFLDVMLPGMDGYDVCKMIKKNKDNSLMKVVMLTSKDKTFDKIRGTMAGCDGYLTKPVDETKLRAIIERHTVTRK